MFPDVSSSPVHEFNITFFGLMLLNHGDKMNLVNEFNEICLLHPGYAVFQVTVQEMCCHWKRRHHQEQQMWKGN